MTAKKAFLVLLGIFCILRNFKIKGDKMRLFTQTLSLKSFIQSFVILSMICAISMLKSQNSKELIEKAEDAGLLPMPQGKDLEDYQKLIIEKHSIIKNYSPKLTSTQIELGKKLFFEPRLSRSGNISCASCHNLGLGGAEVMPAAIGHKWQSNPQHLNSPSVFNTLFNRVHFWDGRVKDLSAQAQQPLTNPVEMANTQRDVVNTITSIPAYVKEFQAAYGNKVIIDFKLIADTIALFEMTLNTPSRYDDFLRGNVKALSLEEQKGLDIFIDKGCTTCHKGINLGGTMQPFEVKKPYEFAHIGGFKGNKDGEVKVPTLRNILDTAPYFHNGQYWDIKDAIKSMGEIQLGKKIDDDEARQIEKFFESLKGKYPTIVHPILPPSTLKTPKPDY